MIITFLKKKYDNLYCVGFHSKSKNFKIYSKYFDEIVVFNKNEIKTQLKEYIDENKISFVFLVNFNAVEKFLPLKDNIGKSMDHYSNINLFNFLNNKSNLEEIVKDTSIKSPKTFDGTTDSIEFPVVIKPNVSTSSKNVHYVKNEQQYFKFTKDNDVKDFSIQDMIVGQGVGCSFFSIEGEVQAAYLHERLIEYPISGGSSTYRAKHESKLVLDGCKEIIKKYKWSGFIMFEFKKRKKDYFLIEVNPRIWGSINQGLNDGINYFEYFFGPAETNQLKTTYNSPLIYLSLLQHLLKFNLKPLFLFIKNMSKNKSDVDFKDDFAGWLSSFIFKS